MIAILIFLMSLLVGILFILALLKYIFCETKVTVTEIDGLDTELLRRVLAEVIWEKSINRREGLDDTSY